LGAAAMDSLHSDSVIGGHHIYRDIWSPFTGEILRVEKEAHNTADHFAVAVVKDETVVGYVPHEVSHIVWCFIEHNGTVTCTKKARYCIGLEVPCT